MKSAALTHPVQQSFGSLFGGCDPKDASLSRIFRTNVATLLRCKKQSLAKKPTLLEEVIQPPSFKNESMKKSSKRSKVVKGQFVTHELNKDELEKAKEMARKIIKRNKRLGDLLAQ